MHLQPATVRGEPSPHLSILVVGGVVLNQNRAAPTVTWGNRTPEESKIRLRVEYLVGLVREACAVQFHRAEDLRTLALARDRDQW